VHETIISASLQSFHLSPIEKTAACASFLKNNSEWKEVSNQEYYDG
jgi:hypothetical protein